MKPRTRGNGQGTAYKRGGAWTAQCTVSIKKDEHGKIIKRNYKTKGGFKTKREALAYIPQLLDQPVGIDTSATFAEMYELWSGQHFGKITNDTKNCYTSAYAHCQKLHHVQFAQLKTADLQSVVDGCDMSRRTKADIKILLVQLYKYAVQNDYINKNYAEFVKLPKKQKPKRDAFTTDEIDALWSDWKTGNVFTGYILLMIYTGMRYGELAILTRDDILLEDRYMVGGIKTEAGINREIPIADCIFPIVERLYNETDKKLLTMHEKVFYNSFRVTLERLGIRPLNPHCCRHTFATLMAKANVPPAVITATAGHESYEMTLEYTHIHVDERLKAVNSIYSPNQ